MKNEKAKIKRAPKRAIYNKDEIYKLLDKDCLCHVAFIHNGYPVVIPTLYGRLGNSIFIHGASISRMITELEKGIDISLSIANVKGLVLARSAFHHSVNYESVVVFGKGKLVDDSKKNDALKIISDNIINGRWEECRLPSENELKATKVIEIEINDISAKVRTGDPVDEKSDYSLDYWAGIIPIKRIVDKPIQDKKLKREIELPESVKNFQLD